MIIPVTKKSTRGKRCARTSPVKVCVLLVFLTWGLLGILAIQLEVAFADEDNLVNPRQLPDSSFIYDTGIIDLSTADSYFNNQTVQVVGEAIGDNIRADTEGGYRWITLISQDANTNATVTIYMTEADAEKVDTYGKHGVTGTLLRVQGTYRLTCPDHEGLSDIHADRVSIVRRGVQHLDELKIESFIPGVVAVIAGLIMLAAFYRIREKRR